MARNIGLFILLSLSMPAGVVGGTWLVEPPPISGFITEESIIHPFIYVGQGGERIVRVCILPTSDFIEPMKPGLLRAIDTFNGLQETTCNFVPTSQEVPLSAIDYESVALHELLHCAAGIGHSNVLPDINPPSLSTNSLVGDDGIFNLSAGGDGRFGTLDDVRGDDVNTFWFQRASNDPFTVAAVVDSSTYSRSLGDLPAGHTFPANGNFLVAAQLDDRLASLVPCEHHALHDPAAQIPPPVVSRRVRPPRERSVSAPANAVLESKAVAKTT